MARVVVCDSPSCGEVIGEGEDWVEVSAMLVRDRPPVARSVGVRVLQFHVRCVPSGDAFTPTEGEFPPRPEQAE
jgi:hypothetical protein